MEKLWELLGTQEMEGKENFVTGVMTPGNSRTKINDGEHMCAGILT